MKSAPSILTGADDAASVRQALLLLEHMHKQLTARLDRVLEPARLSMAEWLIVSELALAGDTSLTLIAQRLSRDPGALSRAITRLIGRGVLGSTRSGKDRRRATLTLTGSGRALHRRLARLIEQAMRAEPIGGALPFVQLLALLEASHGVRDWRDVPSRHGLHATYPE